ncbi:MAG: class I tRNA ligase family protein, partial [bacterium]|nr:class I tRNA ligase family protein [bacterium]
HGNDKLLFNDTPFIPMKMRPQAHDIIRTWTFYTIVKAYMHQKTIPWTDVVISGHVVSDQKEKISKSKESNALSPENLLSRYPADVIRYWTASGSLGQDIAFSENQLKIGLRLVTKIWNAFLFTKEHMKKNGDVPEKLGTINEWLLHTSSQCFDQFTKYLEQNEFGLALNQVEQFFWHHFCDNYVELIKNQLFNPQDYTPQEVTATQWTLYYSGLRILQLYAPYLPHITETIYQLIYKEHETIPSIHQTRFQNIQHRYMFEESAILTQHLITIVSQVRKLKTEQQFSLKVPLASLIIYTESDTLREQLQQQEQLIRGVTHAQEIKYKIGTIDAPVLHEIDGLWHAKVSD